MRAYAIAIFVVFGLSSFSLASEVHQRLRRPRLSIFQVYCVLLVCVSAFGAVTFGVSGLFPHSWAHLLVSIGGGAVAGDLALRCDRYVVHVARRRRVSTARGRASTEAMSIRLPRTVRTGRLGKEVPHRTVGGSRSNRNLRFQGDTNMGPYVISAIAVLEELVFRGFLLSACARLPGIVGALAVLGVVAAFALSHIWFGWLHVIAKLPLGVVTTGCVVMIGGVVIGVVAHLVFNWRVTARLNLRMMAALSFAPPARGRG
jgi:membrane protease YdiL (CAAX protease family)